ncbi:CynX/NimT family MFS transporter [Agrobacterium vitis]|uniref:MFS transporter n=1 Tax=Rhizobium/Agrobacterium group TaxID=227290 RepID=UPI001F2E8F14|nr:MULTISPECIES: MFS transporter [Rhizobium/Agrobacterium group]MCF1501683.1 CynX/NimT family MFS transporter [Allorhizobium sp. Av2]MCM2438531.1 CynX/NimT family MFS transporter [Agrobacterium vitis]MCM2473132.1 CynX/NimT family MFS transporter [Rhizobium sp. CG5]
MVIRRKFNAHKALLIVGLIFVATSLRGPVTAVAPILGELQSTFDLSSALAGFLTTLPLIAFGVLSPFAAIFAREYGLERALFGSLLITIAGIAVRSAGPVWCLYLGTVVFGAGIAVSTVLLPGIFKRDFPAHVPTITGIGAISIGAAFASATAVPLSNVCGWQIALGSVLVFPAVALAAWLPQLRHPSRPTPDTPSPPHGGPVWRSVIAWQVTLLMGVTSLLYYALVGWLPAILTSSGFSASQAGTLHGVMQFAWAVPGLVLGPIVAGLKDQRWLTALMGILTGIAFVGLYIAPSLAALWVPCFGLGTGAGMLLALIFIGLRTGNASQAATLSGMVQCIGNLLAACGPPLAGQLHHVVGNWSLPIAVGGVLSVRMAALGTLAGRARMIAALPSPFPYNRN